MHWEAAKCLHCVADSSSIPTLLEELSDRDSDIKWIAAEALICIGDDSLVPLIERLRDGKAADSFAYYKEAHHVLREVSHRGKSTLLEPLLKAFGQSEPEVGVPVEAAKVLEQLDS